MRRDQMRVDAEPQQAQAVLQVVIPDWLVPFEQLFPAPDVVDEDVQPALVGADPFDELPDLFRDEMIDPDRNAAAARRRGQLRRLTDRIRAREFGLTFPCRAPGDISGRAGRTQLDRDTAAGTSCCACDQRDLSCERMNPPRPLRRMAWAAVKMPRPRTQTDEQLLEASLALMHARGPDALTFANLSEACGLAAATLVQRFGSKATLKQRTFLHAWDRLDKRTTQLAATVPRTPGGAVALLVGLSEQYGGIESYAEGLLVLREELRDPLLRARGAAWKTTLIEVLDGCAPRRTRLLRPAYGDALARGTSLVEFRSGAALGRVRRAEPRAPRFGAREERRRPMSARQRPHVRGGALHRRSERRLNEQPDRALAPATNVRC